MSAPIDGYAGKMLRVDLTNERLSEESFNEVTLRAYLGGTGIGAKILYEEVPPGIEWFDAGNRLILASGPLGGTRVGGSGTFSVVTKGCLSNGATSTQANGFLGAYLRFCGFDGIVIQGAAKRWLYLNIDDNGAELRDASHLLGKDTWESEDLIKKSLGLNERQMSVFCIGPAGESMVKFAAICGDKGHVAGHNGVGAVLGSKKLKAIAVARGKGRIALHDSKRLSTLAREILEENKSNPRWSDFYNWGTLNGIVRGEKTGMLPTKNYTTSVYPIEPEAIERYSGEYIRNHFNPKPNPCWACQMHHCHIMEITEGPYKGEIVEEPEYECFAAWGPLTGQTDVAATMVISNDVDKLGMETNECGYVMGFVMECYDKGIITRKDTDGLEMTWGNAEAVRAMLRKIANREGFGDVLAEGVMRAAARIGGEAPNLAVHTKKGNTVRGHDHRTAWEEMFDTCVSNTGTIETSRFVPREIFGLSDTPEPFSGEEVAKFVAKTKGSMQFEDSLGVCRFNTRTYVIHLTEMVKSATGWDFTFDEAMRMGRRVVNLLRAFNLRHGIVSELDAPSPRYGSTPSDGPAQGVSILPVWDRMLRNYYEMMGWDKDSGKPLPQTLRDLGLEHIIADVWGK